METFEDDDYDELYKVVLIGDPGVGKSNLLSRFSKNEFSVDSKPTSGVLLSTRIIRVDGKIIKAQMWDIGFTSRQESSRHAYYEGVVGALIVYDITRYSSFEHVKMWLKDLRDHVDQTTVVMLIGNKADLGNLRAVPKDEAKAFSEKEKVFCMETSALDTLNVEKALRELLTRIDHVSSQKELGITTDPATVSKGQTSEAINIEKQPLEVCTSSIARFHSPCDQEFSVLKDKLEAVNEQIAEVLSREKTRETELESLRTSVDLLRSTIEKGPKASAQQPVETTGSTTPSSRGKFVFNFY